MKDGVHKEKLFGGSENNISADKLAT